MCLFNLDLIDFFALIISIVALLFSIYAIIIDKKKYRHDLVTNIFTEFLNNENYLKAFRELENNKFTYVSKFDIKEPNEDEEDEREESISNEEKNKYLSLVKHFSILATAKENDLISDKDILLLEYYIRTIINNHDLMRLLEDEISEMNIKEHPFKLFIKMAKAM